MFVQGGIWMIDTAHRLGTARDFDFLTGSWNVRNRLLQQRLQGCDEWDEFASTVVSRPILDGLGNEDEYRTSHRGGFAAMAFRFFDPLSRQWSIYWADARRSGLLDPPVIGGFEGGTGVFEGADTFEGRPILVRFVWSGVTTPTPRWEQSFSADGGDTWEPNWTMDFARREGTR